MKRNEKSINQDMIKESIFFFFFTYRLFLLAGWRHLQILLMRWKKEDTKKRNQPVWERKRGGSRMKGGYYPSSPQTFLHFLNEVKILKQVSRLSQQAFSKYLILAELNTYIHTQRSILTVHNLHKKNNESCYVLQKHCNHHHEEDPFDSLLFFSNFCY